MEKALHDHGHALELPASLVALLVIVLYTYGIFAVAPYAGYYFNPSNGRVQTIFTDDVSLLKVGDVIEQIGNITLQQFKGDRRLVLFSGNEKGDVIDTIVVRDGKQLTIQWVFPGYTSHEFTSRFFNSWMLAYVFWLAGFTAQLSIRPRDLRRSLFIAANYLIALFLISGNLSHWHLWESSTLLHIVSWLIMPVFLHLHWIFPRPLRDIPNIFWFFLYGLAFLFAMGEAFHILGRNFYAFGFIIAILGSAILLISHLIFDKEERQTIRLLLLSIVIAFSFSIASAVAVALGVVLNVGWFTVFSMPFMPLAYFYLVYRERLGGMETRVHRFISTYAFLILLGMVFFAVMIYFIRGPLSHEALSFLSSGMVFIASAITAIYLPRFQTFVDQRFLGIKLPYQHLPESYSRRIAVSTSLPSLLTLLEDEVFPSLLIRQYAFLQASENDLTPLLSKNTPDHAFEFDSLTQFSILAPHKDWTRLILPLKVGDKPLGFWLLGKRDPDDHYPQVEIPILQSLADQTAVALSNILQSDQLRSFYQADIESIENERKRISRDLHDDVLNQLAAMRNSLDQKTLPVSFLSAYDDLKKRLREIINDLRPPMLDQGLAYAINELVEDYREKNNEVNIVLNLQSGEERLPEKMEEHFYHIVREACENALRHADARTLTISGVLSSGRVDLSIEDDGKGFDSNGELNALIANRHFGLATMKERAHIIGTNMDIRSRKNEGTVIHITWQL